MRVLNICQEDWANFSYDNMMALRSVDINADSVKRHPHVWGYERESLVQMSIRKIILMAKHYDVIQFFHDDIKLFKKIIGHFKGRIIVYHTSSFYRKNHVAIDKIMNRYSEKAVCAMPEFMQYCTHKDKIYMVGAIDTNKLKPNKESKYRFAHYPSNTVVKGTSKIIEMMKDYDFHCSTDLIKADKQIDRIRLCDVYIELFSMKDAHGSAYGNFGISALEAAALGKIVVTNCLGIRIYKEHYGRIGLDIANTEEKFKEVIAELNSLSKDELILRKKNVRDWVVKTHSYKASGEYILTNVL